MAWTRTSEGATPYKRLMFYGGPGTGKTTASSTAPNPAWIFFSNEGSEEVLRGRQDNPMTRVGSMREMIAVLEQLKTWGVQGVLSTTCDTLVVDQLSHYSDIMEAELTDNGQRKLDWGKYKSHWLYIRNTLWSLPCHVILTAWSETKTDKNGAITWAGVKLYGQPADAIPGSCDVVGYCEADYNPQYGFQYTTHFRPFGQFKARTRIVGMPSDPVFSFNWNQHIAPYL